MTKRRLACLALAIALVPLLPGTARADGAASTRNILLGGAAATLLIINHNRKVHQKYADYDRRQAETQAQANNAEAAYQSARGRPVRVRSSSGLGPTPLRRRWAGAPCRST